MTTAAEAEERCANLIVLCCRLGAMLAEETAAFEGRRPQDVIASQPETQRLANMYRHESAKIRAQPDLGRPASAATRRQLLAAVQTFEGVLARHGRAVAAAQEISAGIVQAIAAEVASQRNSVSPYGPKAKAGSATVSAIALNKRA